MLCLGDTSFLHGRMLKTLCHFSFVEVGMGVAEACSLSRSHVLAGLSKMDRNQHSLRGRREPPLRPHAPKLSEERQLLLSFYQRYSYRDGPRDPNVNSNIPPPVVATKSQKLQQYLLADVSTRWADLILIVCFLISGLVDSGAYNAYSCFVSMQASRPALSSNHNSPLTTPTDR